MSKNQDSRQLTCHDESEFYGEKLPEYQSLFFNVTIHNNFGCVTVIGLRWKLLT